MFRLRSPLYAQPELTHDCNLGCRHCYNESRFLSIEGKTQLQPVKEENTSPERYKEIAQELVRNDVFAATPTGGEPFKVKDRLYPTAKILAENGLEVTINSNLNLMTEEDAKKLKDIGVTGVMTFLLSYDPSTHDNITQVKGSHAKTLKGIELLQKQGIFTTVNSVVSQHNRGHLCGTGRFAHSLGVQTFSAAQAIPSNSGGNTHLEHALDVQGVTSFLEDLHKIRKDTGMFVKLTNPIPYCFVWESKPHLRYLIETSSCSAGRTIIQIDPSGEVKPCPMVNKSYGNILEEGLEPIWKRMSEWTENQYVPDSCKPCDLSDVCRGGCRAESERRVGNLDSRNPFSVKPIKLNPDDFSFSIKPGTRMSVVEGLKTRQEQEGVYVLFAHNKHMIASEASTRFIAALAKKGSFEVDEQVLADEPTKQTIMSAYNAGLMYKEEI